MHSIEIVLAMLLAVLASGYLARMLPLALPLPLVQIAFGAIIAGVFNEGVALDPQVFFLLFLPPLLFLDGWRIPKDGLFRDRSTIVQLAFGLVVFTVLGAGYAIHWMIPDVPLAAAFALAAIVSPTDPVAVSSIARRVPIPKRLMHVLEGESLLNDASGLVCFRFAVAAVMTGGFSLTSAAVTFVWLALGGLGIGIAFTLAASLVQNWVSRHFGEETGTPILLSVLIPFGAYLLAEHLKASGILAAVAAGICMSYVELSGRALATTRVQRAAVWDMLQFSLNGIMFVLLGEQLPGIVRNALADVSQSGGDPWRLLVYALVLNAMLALMRFSWVWVSMRINRLRAKRQGEEIPSTSWRLVAASSLAGVRGAITLAGVLTLPLMLPGGELFPARNVVIFLAGTVILFSLLAASSLLPHLLNGLQLPVEDQADLEEDLALRVSADAAIAAIERTLHTIVHDTDEADVYTQAATRVMALYERRRADRELAGVDAPSLRRADQAERTLRLAGWQAERESIYRLVQRHQISDATARRLVRQIDLVESRYRS